MLLDNFARQLTFDLESPERVARDDEEAYTVAIDANIRVKISWLDPGFYFEVPIAVAPSEGWDEEQLLLFLLANLMGQGTGGGALALDSRGEKLLLTDSIPKEVAYVEFRDVLERIVNYADYWKKKVTEKP